MIKNRKNPPVHDFNIELSLDNYSYITASTVINGNINSASGLVIHGTVNGDVKSDAEILIGSSAVINGNVSAKSALIQGNIKGNINLSDWITLKKGSTVIGDICANNMTCEKNIKLQGKIQIGENSEINESTSNIIQLTSVRAKLGGSKKEAKDSLTTPKVKSDSDKPLPNIKDKDKKPSNGTSEEKIIEDNSDIKRGKENLKDIWSL